MITLFDKEEFCDSSNPGTLRQEFQELNPDQWDDVLKHSTASEHVEQIFSNVCKLLDGKPDLAIEVRFFHKGQQVPSEVQAYDEDTPATKIRTDARGHLARHMIEYDYADVCVRD